MLYAYKKVRSGLFLFLTASLAFSSCCNTYRDFLVLPPSVENLKPSYPFQFERHNPVLYDLGIRTKNQYFSGIFIFKKEEDLHYRLAMISKMGNKIFDMEYRSGQFELHHIIGPLNRRLVIDMMQDLFALMLENKDPTAGALYLLDPATERKVVRWKSEGEWQSVFINKEDIPVAYHKGNSRQPKVTIRFEGSKNGHPAEIVLENEKWVRFEMLFSQLDR